MTAWPNPDKPGFPLNPERDWRREANYELEVLAASSGPSIAAKKRIAALLGDLVRAAEAVPASLAAARAEGAEAMREACAKHVERITEWGGQDYYCDSCKGGAIYPDREDVARDLRALPIPAADALARREAEKRRIARALIDEGDVTPCSEDRKVVFDCARLVLCDFSYDDAESLPDEAAIRARAGGGDAPCMRCDGGECQRCEGNPT